MPDSDDMKCDVIVRLNVNGSRSACAVGAAAGAGAGPGAPAPDERDYYNDMPDKMPPDVGSHRHPPPPPLASLAPISS